MGLMASARTQEQTALSISIYASVVFAALSFMLGILLRSQVILFDGLYSLIGVVLSWSTIATVRFMKNADWENFPFGKEALEPLVVMIRYLALIALIAGSGIAALIAVLRGGRDIVVGAGLGYAAFATVFCYAMYRYLHRKNRTLRSSFIQTELNEWYLDTIVSAGVVFGFAVALVMSQVTRFTAYVVYVDPVMMLVISVYFVKWPLAGLRRSLREVLGMKPEGKLTDEITAVVREIERRQGLAESFVRVTKIGRQLWVEIDFVVGRENNSRVNSIADQDRIREEIMLRLPSDQFHIWLSVGFTGDRKWAL